MGLSIWGYSISLGVSCLSGIGKERKGKETKLTWLDILPAVWGVCERDGKWRQTENGKIQALPCEGDFIGDYVRQCSSTGSWGEVDDSFCLPMYPDEGYGYVDFTIIISDSKWRTIQNYPHGIVNAFSVTYGVVPDSISVFRIAAIETDVTLWELPY